VDQKVRYTIRPLFGQDRIGGYLEQKTA
jgi:hypothetical protein